MDTKEHPLTHYRSFGKMTFKSVYPLSKYRFMVKKSALAELDIYLFSMKDLVKTFESLESDLDKLMSSDLRIVSFKPFIEKSNLFIASSENAYLNICEYCSKADEDIEYDCGESIQPKVMRYIKSSQRLLETVQTMSTKNFSYINRLADDLTIDDEFKATLNNLNKTILQDITGSILIIDSHISVINMKGAYKK